MRKRSSLDFSSYRSRDMPVRKLPCGLRICNRYVNRFTPSLLQAHLTQPSSSSESLRFGWHRWIAHQRKRSAGGSCWCRSQRRQQVTMLSTPPERLSTRPRDSLRSPSSCRERRSTSTTAWPSKRLRVVGSRRPARKGRSAPPAVKGGTAPAAVACRWQRASRTSSRGNTPSGGPTSDSGSSAVSAVARYASTFTAWAASCVSRMNRSQIPCAATRSSPASIEESSAETAKSIRSDKAMSSGCRECRRTKDRKQSSAGVPSARSPVPESGPPASASADMARGSAAASQAVRRPGTPGELSPRTDAMFRDIWSRKIAARSCRRANARGGPPVWIVAQAPPMPIG
mmetsp:Transcript_12353/g.35034  ORF Transcript_12353/g.35034 Transcript_12353/m.35034 type:complete len:343 (-) Transcript_12353:248-1276(-)